MKIELDAKTVAEAMNIRRETKELVDSILHDEWTPEHSARNADLKERSYKLASHISALVYVEIICEGAGA